jgi:hypothetical protein
MHSVVGVGMEAIQRCSIEYAAKNKICEKMGLRGRCPTNYLESSSNAL